MRLFCWLFCIVVLSACSKPIDTLRSYDRIALVAVKYDPNIYYFHPHMWVDPTRVYAEFTGKPGQSQIHENMLNEFLVDIMSDTVERTDISIVRPLKLLNTSLMQTPSIILYEYLLDPYDPIDINNRVFMAGLAERLNVDAVCELTISFAVHLDEKMLWEEYKDPYAKTLNAHRMQVKRGHESSLLKTTIGLTVVDRLGNTVYQESRYVVSHSDSIVVDDRDLSFDGGISPKLLQMGLNDWLADWLNYLPDLR